MTKNVMRYFYNFTESNWVQTYKHTDQTWLVDSLNWDQVTSLAFSDYSLMSFIYNSSFLNQHFLTDYLTKASFVDIYFSIFSATSFNNAQLYYSFLLDIYLNFNLCFYSTISLFTSGYQDLLTILFIFAPEVINAFNDYFCTYVQSSTYTTVYKPLAVFDSYTSNLNFNFSDNFTVLFMFFFFGWFMIYFFYMGIILKWSTFSWNQALRTYFYFFSLSKESRIQFETVLQSVFLFVFYWSMTIMAFDDDKEEVIEYLDNSLFYFFTFVLLYFFFKHSIHYFSFLEASAVGSRSVMFLVTQFRGDFLAFFSVVLRFYSLLLRLNIYDILDDCLDFYYVFIGDFNDDEYLQELFVSLHGTTFFSNDNQDDRSFLLEEENDFFNDIFYLYFILWGKFFYFLFYTVELAARFGLAFYVIYLVLFEIYGVNCSYKEDNYFELKRSL